MTLALREQPVISEASVPSVGSLGGDVLLNGGAMTQTRTSYATAVAVQKPRILASVQRRLIEEADLAGEDFFYGWGTGNDKIEGGSIDLALAAVRCWGNCAVELLPVVETAHAWIFTAAFVDLETGFTLSRQFRQSKSSKVFGKHDEERKMDIRFQIGQSKAIRNVVLNAVPRSLTNGAMDQAKAGVRAKLEKFIEDKGLPAAVQMVLRGLAKHGVTEERVLSKVAVANKTAVTIDHLISLRGDLAALDAGRDWPAELFPDPKAPPAGGLADRLKDKAPAATDAEGDQRTEDEIAEAARLAANNPPNYPVPSDEPEQAAPAAAQADAPTYQQLRERITDYAPSTGLESPDAALPILDGFIRAEFGKGSKAATPVIWNAVPADQRAAFVAGLKQRAWK
jgi:hypothetical protein